MADELFDAERPGWRRRYPRIHFEALDREEGVSRVLDLDFSTLRIDDAYIWEREIEWAITCLFQWRDLVHKLWGNSADDSAKEFLRAELRRKLKEKQDATS